MILLVQIRSVVQSRRRVCVINFRAIDFLERLHRADGGNQLQIGVITQQIPGKEERERRHAVFRHEIANLQAHLREVLFRQRLAIRLILNAQHRMLVAGAAVGVFAGDAQADHRTLAEVLFVFRRIDKVAENIAVQFAKLFRNAEVLLVLVVFQQAHAEIIIPHVRREVISDDARDTQVIFLSTIVVCNISMAGNGFSAPMFKSTEMISSSTA